MRLARLLTWVRFDVARGVALLVSSAGFLRTEVLQRVIDGNHDPQHRCASRNLNVNKPLSGAPTESTQAGAVDRTAQGATVAVDGRTPQTSRFPTRARDAGGEGQTNVETKIETSSPAKTGRNRPVTLFVRIHLQS